jgi:phytoene synthase
VRSTEFQEQEDPEGDPDESLALLDSIISKNSKSFALSSRLLPRGERAHALALYAYCRRADDAVDLAGADEAATRLDALRAELDALYRGEPLADPIAAAFQRVVRARRIPRLYLDELLLGFEMDVRGQRYENLPELLRYCHCVAGTVGLMMCHVMGVRDERALAHAAHLGIAMQLTNICRDVLEDLGRSRLYLPLDAGAPLPVAHDAQLTDEDASAAATATRQLLSVADRYYASADAGLLYLSPRCALAVRAARLIYARIGEELQRQGCDPRAGRAIVPRSTKLWLALRACGAALWDLVRAPRGAVTLPSACLQGDPTTLPAFAHARGATGDRGDFA